MAKQINHFEKIPLSEEEERTEAITKLVDMTAENHKALMTLIEVVEELHAVGILDMVKGMLKTRQKLGVMAVEELNQPSMHNVIRNGTNAFKFLGQLEADQLQTMLDGVSSGLVKSAEPMSSEGKIGMWGMAKKMKDPDINASITTLFGFLQGMGEEFNKEKQPH